MARRRPSAPRIFSSTSTRGKLNWLAKASENIKTIGYICSLVDIICSHFTSLLKGIFFLLMRGHTIPVSLSWHFPGILKFVCFPLVICLIYRSKRKKGEMPFHGEEDHQRVSLCSQKTGCFRSFLPH